MFRRCFASNIWCQPRFSICQKKWDYDYYSYYYFKIRSFFVCWPCRKFGSSYTMQQPSTEYSYRCVQYFHVSKQWYGCQCLGFLMCVQMLIHAIAHGGCTITVRESALKVGSGRKILCLTWDSNPCQYCALLTSSAVPHPWFLFMRSVQVRIATTAKHGIHCSFEECSGGECCNSPAWDSL